jgi:predicted ATPase
MKLTSLELSNFSVARSARFSFSTDINVFIGRNGAGKSHILKLLYTLLRARRDSGESPTDEKLARDINGKLAGVSRPDDGSTGRLVSRGVGRNTSRIHLRASKDESSSDLEIALTTLSNLRVPINTFERVAPSVFIPSREVLAMYEGFVQAYEERELSFDETYRDLCVQLGGALLRGPRLEAVRKLAAPLEEVLGGSIRLLGNRFYRQAPGGNLEAHLLSEGLRKIGALTHLVLNGSIIKNGFLLWDEPEANLNPKLVTVIARTLRVLAGMGIQIFVATHDFLLLNELALADDFKDSLPKGEPRVDIKFFGLNLAEDGTHVKVEEAEQLRSLSGNDILDEFAAFYDRRSEALDRALSWLANSRVHACCELVPRIPDCQVETS